jgi:hypothetical protein
MTRLGWYFAFMFSSWATVLAMCSCIERWDAVDPNSQAKTKDYPCGPLWHVCFDVSGKDDGTCCPNGDACNVVFCPPDECCDERMGVSRGDAGATTHVQRRHRKEAP